MTNTSGPDLDNRDPNTLSEYLQPSYKRPTEFTEDILAAFETKYIKTIDSVFTHKVEHHRIQDKNMVEFDDVIAEPRGAYSVDCVWKVAYKIFTGTKNYCYKFLTILFAFPIALAVGLSFAILSFQHIWCIGPAIRHFRISCHVVRLYVRTCLDSCLAPCCNDMGLFFSKIRITRGPGTEDQVL